MRHFLVGIACLICGMFAGVGEARAEIMVAECTEWVVASSDRIVVGKVVERAVEMDGEKRGHVVLTVEVKQVLKGEAGVEGFLGERVVMVLPPRGNPDFGKKWKEDGTLAAYCLVKNEGKRAVLSQKKYPWILREDDNGVDAIVMGPPPEMGQDGVAVVTRDYRVIKDEAGILTFLEATVKEMDKEKPTRSFGVDLRMDSEAHDRFYSGSSVYLKLPVDSKLEAWAVARVASKNAGEREESAQILRHFKSEKNIALLKTLLEDPAVHEVTYRAAGDGASQAMTNKKKVFYVRAAAFNSLSKMGEKVEKPVTEVLLEGRDEPIRDWKFEWNE